MPVRLTFVRLTSAMLVAIVAIAVWRLYAPAIVDTWFEQMPTVEDWALGVVAAVLAQPRLLVDELLSGRFDLEWNLLFFFATSIVFVLGTVLNRVFSREGISPWRLIGLVVRIAGVFVLAHLLVLVAWYFLPEFMPQWYERHEMFISELPDRVESVLDNIPFERLSLLRCRALIFFEALLITGIVWSIGRRLRISLARE